MIFQFHVFECQRVISMVKQFLQLKYASKSVETGHAPGYICYLDSQKVWKILDNIQVNGSCCSGRTLTYILANPYIAAAPIHLDII